MLLLSVVGFFPSCDFLDVEDKFEDTLNYDSIFARKYNLEKYLWGIAASFSDEGAIWGGTDIPGVTATDEAFVQWDQDEFRGVQFTKGTTTPDNLTGMNIWPGMYKIIRKTNIIFSRIDECGDLTTNEKRTYLSYARFMRAYAYYRLMMSYGPVVILGDEVFETNENPVYYDRARNTMDETFDYICSEMETAAKGMPTYTAISEFGRPTKGAAYGMVARVRMMQASPAFNGEVAAKRYFGEWQRSTDGADYVSFREADERRWAVAAVACKRVMDMGLYKLFTVQDDDTTPELPQNTWDTDLTTKTFAQGGGLGIDPYRSYKEMFSGEAIAVKNPEYIWGRNSGSVQSYTTHSFPVGKWGGWNGMSIPQKIIDAYYMSDGSDIKSTTLDYSEDVKSDGNPVTIGAPKTFSGYQLGGDVWKMYNDREMRFYACIGFNGCYWANNSTSKADFKNRYVTYYSTGTADNTYLNAGRANTDGDLRNYPITGYVTKKYIHDDDAKAGDNSSVLPKSFPIMRYAEILISYAEALNNLTQSWTIPQENDNGEIVEIAVSRNTDEIAAAFNQIRHRAGLPGLKPEELAEKNTLFDVIVREKMIEFFHENHRFYDVRRWGIYEDVDRESIVGLNTMGKKAEFFERTTVMHTLARNRIVNKKMVFLPLGMQEIRKAPKLDQNPGWDD